MQGGVSLHKSLEKTPEMIKRTIEISREAAHLSVRHKQLLLKRHETEPVSIPCEDLGVVVVDHPQTTYTHAALAELLEHDAVLVICGTNHLPCGIVLPLSNHHQVVWRVQDQANASKPLQKQLWKQLVRAKILAQAGNLEPGSIPRRKLENLAREVKSGDPANLEAQAARIYWSAWLTQPSPSSSRRTIPRDNEALADQIFRRNPEEPGLNSLLNYGYAILRAAVARAIVAAGLHPALGLHHSNRGNPFCLADDLMEPLRPMVDEQARELFFAGHDILDQPTKAHLLELLGTDVRFGGETGPLMVTLHRYVTSLVKCYQGLSKQLSFPTSIVTADTQAVPEEVTLDELSEA